MSDDDVFRLEQWLTEWFVNRFGQTESVCFDHARRLVSDLNWSHQFTFATKSDQEEI